ncbi:MULTISPECIES: hypothetical protein [unclassified Vibrio]|uniref:hypothetical protein n=1 Tax=unclassified Vibrio TaxID=2614977 RepID=UPI00159D3713|nr:MULTISPECIES: hypothetical protein [unclassified Vibrio]NVN80577.1 hypothetical protein [Vibrio sp. Scap16]QLE95609.1 hypothetical protein FLM53_21805 [Vibrio sp. Scap24]
MNSRPEPLSTDVLNELNKLVPEEAAKHLELWRQEYKNYLTAVSNQESEKLIDQRHLRNYRILTVMSGTFLALSSLALCAFAIHEKADLVPLAAVLTPIAGIAGVFVWGYRPNKAK